MKKMYGFISGGLLTLLLVGGFVLLIMAAVKLSPPPEIRLLTGPEGSTFYQDGLRYREILSRHGVTVHVEKTLGTIENVKSLIEAEVPTAAFGEGIHALEEEIDVELAEQLEGITSLGAMSLQPMWVFRLKGTGELAKTAELKGRRIASGWKGSSARMMALIFLDNTGADDEVELEQLNRKGDEMTASQAVEALLAKRVVAVIATGQADAPLIDGLLRSPELEVTSIARAEAIVLQFPFLKEVRLPEGAYDLRENIPSQNLQLLAAGTELLVSDDFPPALADLLVEAASEVHSEPTMFSTQNEFPDPEMVSLPLNKSAALYYKDGPPALRKFLPFRWATLIDRFSVVLMAIGSLVVGLFSVLPKLLTAAFERKLGAIYRRFEAVERSLAGDPDRKALLSELDELDQMSNDMRVPMKSQVAPWMEQRQNLYDLRDRVAC
jgi:TRAP-type uncharacterized transport system substrate-binding protein